MKLAPFVVVLAVLTLAGCASTPAPKPDLKTSGSISTPIDVAKLLSGAIDNTQGAACTSKDGYDDIAEGAQVIVTNASGKTVAIGALDGGTLTPGAGGSAFDARCVFPFAVKGIPAGGKFYGIHVGNEARGVHQADADEISAGDIELSLGS